MIKKKVTKKKTNKKKCHKDFLKYTVFSTLFDKKYVKSKRLKDMLTGF